MEKRAAVIDRRRQTLRSLIHGGLFPRRAVNRRPGDDQKYIVDIYDQGLVMVAIAIVIMSCMDAFFTLNILAIGGEELNYVMRVLIESDVRSFLGVKFTGTACGVVFLVALSNFRMLGILPVRRIIEGLCAMYACLIIWELYLLVGVAAVKLV